MTWRCAHAARRRGVWQSGACVAKDVPEWLWWVLVWLLVGTIVALVVGAILRGEDPDQAAPGSPPDDIDKSDL